MLKNVALQSSEIAFRYRKLFCALVAISAGLLIASSAARSGTSLEALSSMLLMGLFALITLYSPLGGFLLWLFLTTFIDSWVEIPLGRGIPDLSFGRFAVFALTVSLLMRAGAGTIRFVPFSLTDLCALLAPLAIVLSAPLSVEPLATVQTAISVYLIPMAGFILAKQFVRTQQQFHWLLAVIALFGMVAGVHAIYESLTGDVIFVAKEQLIERTLRAETNLRLISGLVGETGSMGRVLAVTLLVTLYFITENKNSYSKPFWMVGVLLQFGGLVVTFSRTPLLTFLLGLFILQFFYPSLRRLLILLTLIVAVTLALNWRQIQSSEAAQDRLSGIEDYNGRTSRWVAGLQMWFERPIRGWGMGRYAEWSGRYRADGSRQNIEAVENDYLLILVGAGLAGFLPYALFLLTTLASSLRLYLRRQRLEPPAFIRPGTIALAWAVMACFLFSSFTAINSIAVTRLFPFVLMGAIVGSHQYLLARRPSREDRATVILGERVARMRREPSHG